MQIVKDQISVEELRRMSEKMFGNIVKAVVDIERGVIAIDGELHADLELLLTEDGSKRENVWGINFHPEATGDEFIEFDSMINLKPQSGNRTRGVDDEGIRKKIMGVVNKLVKK